MVKIVNDNYMYARVAKLIGSRKEFTEDKLPQLEEIVMDESKAKTIYDATKVSMGMSHFLVVILRRLLMLKEILVTAQSLFWIFMGSSSAFQGSIIIYVLGNAKRVFEYLVLSLSCLDLLTYKAFQTSVFKF